MRRWIATAAVPFALALAPRAAWAGKFGGFSADLTRYLDGTGTVCEPLRVDASGEASGAPSCERRTAAEVKAMKFKLPRRTTTIAGGALKVRVVADGRVIRVVARPAQGPAQGDDRVLARWDAGAEVTSVTGPFGEGTLFGVEYKQATGMGAVAFDVTASLEGAAPARGLAQRLLGRGGKWTQRLIPCEQAGVTLELKAKWKFRITIQTRCQSDRDHLVLSGTWVTGDPDVLRLVFSNDDGPDEVLDCRVGACPDDGAAQCVTCTSDDVTFSLSQ